MRRNPHLMEPACTSLAHLSIRRAQTHAVPRCELLLPHPNLTSRQQQLITPDSPETFHPTDKLFFQSLLHVPLVLSPKHSVKP